MGARVRIIWKVYRMDGLRLAWLMVTLLLVRPLARRVMRALLRWRQETS